MFVGTASDVGKSVVTTGFCRIFKQDGYHPAPFKAQNMSLNSYATPESLEIGRAQAVQAEACGIPCHTDMNPVLLKPTTDKSSQVIIHGRPAGNFSAAEYFLSDNRETLFTEVKKAYHRLAGQYSPIVMEGAGSISELNLKQRDITNMRMASEAGAATYLVTDIDRGGIFGSLYGTMALLTPEEKVLIKGIIINKFRGDPQLFVDGRKMLEELCGVPVVGILPFFRDIFIEAEDSIPYWQRQAGPNGGKWVRPTGGEQTGPTGREQTAQAGGKVNIAVVLLNRLSNFTDFDRLGQDSRVNLYYTREAAEIAQADIVILPGSKNTMEDLLVLQNNGAAAAIRQAFFDKKTVIGICGGYQMMGKWVEDPLHVETAIDRVAGLGLLPVQTVMQGEKTTRQCGFRFRNSKEVCNGYEIHMGDTRAIGEESPLNYFPGGGTDGYFLHDKCWGTYLHGILDNPAVINDLVAPYTDLPGETFDYRQFKDAQYDKLADLIRQHIDMAEIYKTLQS